MDMGAVCSDAHRPIQGFIRNDLHRGFPCLESVHRRQKTTYSSRSLGRSALRWRERTIFANRRCSNTSPGNTFEEVTQPWFGSITGDAFVEGGSYLYYFIFGKHCLLHQRTGGFIEDKLAGLQADVALLYPMARNDMEIMLKAVLPKTVFVHHFDEWRKPFSDGLPESNARRAERFVRDVKAIDGSVNVIISKFFEPHLLD